MRNLLTSTRNSLLVALCGSAVAAARGDCVSMHGGTIRTLDVTIPQQGGGTLTARLYAPQASLQTAPCPCVALLPGGGGGVAAVHWAAELLAAAGYVVINVQPQVGSSVDSYNTAAKSEIDFLLSPANPFRADADGDWIGAAGWSLGARALARTQDEDSRLDAIVAWDNLAKSEAGDAGSPGCTNQPIVIRTPRVPAMGQASEICANGPQSKKTAYEHWRAAAMPAMEVVFEGWDHFGWATVAPPEQHQLAHYYTLAWFDRWLKSDRSATQRLLAQTVGGVPLSAVLSDQFFSAAFLDGYVCPDLRSQCSIGMPVPGDLTGDQIVNGMDLAVLLAAWGPCASGAGPACAADFDGNGLVNGLDLAMLLGLWSPP